MGTATSHLRALGPIREHELRLALKYFPTPVMSGRQTRVLEVGAGTGHQARLISEAGYGVIALDVPASSYANVRVYDILDYDGKKIPLADGAVDVVFSSNVLEHIADIDGFLAETRRVLKPGGFAIHVLPSSACRFWSYPAHYVWLAHRALSWVLSRLRSRSSAMPRNDAPKTPVGGRQWVQTLFPTRHGERGNVLTEIYYFSRRWWVGRFRRRGFDVVEIKGNGLFYTLSNSLAHRLGIERSRCLAKLLGDACHVYVLSAHNAPSAG